MHKIILILFITLLHSIISLQNLTAYTQEIIDENIETTKVYINAHGQKWNYTWPSLHKYILERDFDKVLLVLDFYPKQALEKVPMNFSNQDFDDYWNEYRMSCLELAILFDAPIEIIEKIILLGADVNNHRVKKGSTNCKQGSKDIIPRDRIKENFPVSCSYYEIRTPLLAAVIKRNDEAIQLLLNYGANSEQVVYEEEIIAVDIYEKSWNWKRGNWINLNDLHRRENGLLDVKTDKDTTSLENLASVPLKNLTTAYTQEILDEEQEKTAYVGDEKSWPALHRFLVRRDFARAQQVIDIYPDEAKLTVPMSSLELAIRCKAPVEMIEEIIWLGANVNHHSRDKSIIDNPEGFDKWKQVYEVIRTPLFFAVIDRNYEAVQLLLDYGANPEQVLYEDEYLTIEHFWGYEAGSNWLISNRKSKWFNLNDLFLNVPSIE